MPLPSSYKRLPPVDPKTGKRIRKNPEKFEKLFIDADRHESDVSLPDKLCNMSIGVVPSESDIFDNLLDSDRSPIKCNVNKNNSASMLASSSDVESSFSDVSIDMFGYSIDDNDPEPLQQKPTKPESKFSQYEKLSESSEVFESAQESFTTTQERISPSIARIPTLSSRSPLDRSWHQGIMTSTPARCPKKVWVDPLSPLVAPALQRKISTTDDQQSFDPDKHQVTNEISIADALKKSTEKNISLAELSFVLKCKGGKGWKRDLKKSLRRETERRIAMQPDASLAESDASRILHDSRSILVHIPADKDSDIPKYSIAPAPEDAKSVIFNLCNQKEFVSTSKYFIKCKENGMKKIGEGTFGEVFMVRPTNAAVPPSVLKIIPIEGDECVNGEPQKKFDDILSELIVSRELSDLRNSNKSNSCTTYAFCKSCKCLEGAYTEDLLYLWDCYAQEKDSENDRPDFFPDSQVLLMFEYEHAGRDLENYVLGNAEQGLSVLFQVAYSLAVAEKELQFEHRDLHWGNILIAPTEKKKIDFYYNNESRSVHSKGIKTTIIDFTMSRLTKSTEVYFNDLSQDPTLFTSEGDYQFEIYRKMKIANDNDWSTFHPETNTFWLHYLCRKILEECAYKNTRSKIHKNSLTTLKHIENEMLFYKSASAFVDEYLNANH